MVTLTGPIFFWPFSVSDIFQSSMSWEPQTSAKPAVACIAFGKSGYFICNTELVEKDFPTQNQVHFVCDPEDVAEATLLPSLRRQFLS